MNIFLLDKNLRVCKALDSKGDVNSSPFFNDNYVQYLETGAETFEFEALQTEFLEVGNYVAFRYDEYYKLFQISEISDMHEENLTQTVYCETAGLELVYEVLRPREIPSANIAQYLENVLGDTSWKLGYVDDRVTDIHTIEIDNYVKIYEDIQERIALYNCEISFRVEIKNNKVIGKYIDVYKKRGDITNYRFEYSENVSEIERKVNAFELCTAIIGTGKDGMTFKDAEWFKSKGDPCDKPKNQDFIADETAFKLYNNNGQHLMGHFECDLESPYDILHATYKALQDRNRPKVSYEVNVSLVGDVRMGDEVYVIDNSWKPNPLHLSARVNELHTSFTDSSKNKCIMSNFKNIRSKITDDMRDIKNQLDKIDGSTVMGIAKGGFLTSNLEMIDSKIHIKNKLVNDKGQEYFFDVGKESQGVYMNDIMPKDSRYVTQSFAIDFENKHLYTSQVVTETNPEHVLISKIDVNTRQVLGYMKLHGFGHGSQIGIDKLKGYVSLWIECDGEPHINTGKLFGTKICRLKFEGGKEYTTNGGNVYDLVPDARNISVSIDEAGNRLCVKAITYANKNIFYVYDLNSVINNNPRNLAKIAIPSWLEPMETPHQGHSVCGNRVYHYQGSEKSISVNNDTRVTALDFNGNVLESTLIDVGLDDKVIREPEGIFVRNDPYSNAYQMYLGYSIGVWPNRKFNISLYIDKYAESGYINRGNFKHPNAHTSEIDEGYINTENNPNANYLVYVDENKRFNLNTDDNKQFIIANTKGGKWYHKGNLFDVNYNDCVIAEIKNGNMTVFTSSNDGSNIPGVDGEDGYTTFLTNQAHVFNADNEGNITESITTSTEIKAFKKNLPVPVKNIAIPIVEGLTISNNNEIITVTANSGNNLTSNGSFDINFTLNGAPFTLAFSWTKVNQGNDGAEGEKGEQGTPGVSGSDGKTSYFHIKYSNDGQTFTDNNGETPGSWIGQYVDFNEIDSNDFNRYSWKRIEGSDGEQGIPGDKGDDGLTSYLHIKYSDDGKVFTGNYGEVPGSWIGQYVDFTQQDSRDFNDYSWKKIEGEPGKDGTGINILGSLESINQLPPTGKVGDAYLIDGDLYVWAENIQGWQNVGNIQGEQGIPGQPGQDGETYYTWIKYADSEQGLNMGDNPKNENGSFKKYIGMAYNKESKLESTNPSDYTWSLIKGEDGVNAKSIIVTGEQVFKYASNFTGNPTPLNIILNTITSNVSSSNYSWYYKKAGQSSTTTIGGAATSTFTLSHNNSIWGSDKQITIGCSIDGVNDEMTIVKLSDGMNGSDGQDGSNGQDGYTVYLTNQTHSFSCTQNGNISNPITTSTEIKAFCGINAKGVTDISYPTVQGLSVTHKDAIVTITANTGTSLSLVGSFDISFKVDNKPFKLAFSWSKVKDGQDGSNGQPGLPGQDGEDGKTYYTWIKYADNEFGLNMSDTPYNKDYIGIAYNKESQTESTNPADYSWSLFKGEDGVPGQDGESGITYYTWLKYADSPTTGMSDNPNGKKYMGIAYNKESSIESTNYGDYFWSLIKGSDSTAYWVISSAGAISKNVEGAFNPQSITFNAKSQSGEGTVGSYSGRFKIFEVKGSSSLEVYRSANDESQTSYRAMGDITAIKVEFYKAGNFMYLLDEQNIPVVFDGNNGQDGEDGYTAVLSNDSHVVPTNSNGDVTSFGGGVTTISILEGSNDVSEKWTYSLTKGQGINGTLTNNNRTFTLNALSVDSSYVDFTASRTGYSSIIKRFSVSKSKQGKDGSGVNILGSLESEAQLPSTGNPGEAYLIKGDLYVWSANSNTWENVGRIQGNDGVPGVPGSDGVSLYTWIKYSDYEDGTNMSDSEKNSDGSYKKYIGLSYNNVSKTESTNPKDYTWSKIKGEDGTSYYFHIRYSQNSNGNPMTENPVGAVYMGTCSTSSAIAPTNPNSYKWSKILGEDGRPGANGEQGVPGEQGEDGRTSYLHIKYSNDGKVFTANNGETPGSWIGQYVDFVQADSSVFNDYTWKKIEGSKGDQGIPGLPGADGKTLYTWIRYADNENGSGMSNFPIVNGIPKKYIGMAYNKESQTESENPSDYTWSKLLGDQGIPGDKGTDGKTYYTWVKYADNETGLNMNDNPKKTDGTFRTHIGLAHNKESQTESTNYKDYTWSLYKGDKGDKGEDGTGVTILGSLENESQLPAKGSPGDAYLIDGDLYVWSDNTNSWKNVGSIQGAQGVPGVPGADGSSLYTWIKYSDYENGKDMSDSAKKPDGSFYKYIGFSYNNTNQMEGNNPADYSWSLVKGDKGDAGTSQYFHVRYSKNSNGSGMVESPVGAVYMGTCVTATSVAPTSNTSYKWSKILGDNGSQGIPGQPGSNGQTSYLHIKYSNDGSSFTDNNGEVPGSWLGQYTDFNSTDSNIFSKYTWVKIEGVQGSDGTPGIPGQPGTPGQSQYFHIRYSQNSNGNPMTSSPSGAIYIGTAITTSSTAPSSYSNYAWAKILGDKGETGQQGIPGNKGDNGLTSYLHIKYSNDGKTFTANGGETPGSWLGQYVDYTLADSTNFNDYAWKKIEGNNGLNAIVCNLTNDSHVIPTDQNGNGGNFTGCNTIIELYEGANKLTTGVSYSFALSSGVTGSGNASNGTYTVTALSADSGYVDLTATYNSKSYVKRFTITKAKKGSTGSTGSSGSNGSNGQDGADGEDSYTVQLSNDSHVFSAQSNGNIGATLVTATTVFAYKGSSSMTPSIGTLPSVTGLTLTKSGNTITITANTGTSLADTGSFDISIVVDGKNFTKTFSWSKARQGNNGQPGLPGQDANLLDWVKDWDGKKLTVGTDKLITPKLFAGTMSSGKQTGVAIGTDVFGTGTNFTGIVGYNNAIRTFHLDTSGSAMFGKSVNDPHIRFDAVGGTVSIKGSVNITGGTVPSNTLNGIIDNSKLNSSIVAGATNGTSAKGTLDSKASGWDSAKTTVDSNKVNWSNAYNRVAQWAYGAVSGSTTINGGLIQTNTILADKIAIGDFSNYNELTPDNLLGKFSKETDGTQTNNPWLKLNVLNRDITLSRTYQCSGGESFRITADISTTVKGATSSGGTTIDFVNTNIAIYGKKKDGTSFYNAPTGRKNSTGTISVTTTIPNDAVSFYVSLQNAGWTPFSGICKVRNVKVQKMSTGELIVDGAITSTKLHSDAITTNHLRGKTIEGSVIISTKDIGEYTHETRVADACVRVTKNLKGGNLSVSNILIQPDNILVSGDGGQYEISSNGVKNIGTGNNLYLNGSGGGNFQTDKDVLKSNGMVVMDSNMYLGVDVEVRVTDKKGYNSGGTLTYKPIKASEFRRSDGKTAYINGTGGGTLNAVGSLESAGMKSTATDMYLGVDGEVRATDKNGYNGGTITYKNIRGYNVMAQNKLYQAGQGVTYSDRVVENEVSDIVLSANVRHDTEGGLSTSYYTHSVFDEGVEKDGSLDIQTQISMLVKTVQKQNKLIEKLEQKINSLEGVK